MPTLRNPRHEKFALALSEGKSASQAYVDAGYKPCRQNAARLMTNDDINARLAEIQSAAAKKAEVTIESLLAELEQARAKATDLDQLSAAVRAIEAKAKVSGLLVQRQEVTIDARIEVLDRCETIEQIAEVMLRGMINHPAVYEHLITPADIQAAHAIMASTFEQLGALVETIEARAPHRQYVQARPVRPSQYALEALRPGGNGRA